MSPTTARLRASCIRTINNSARRPSCILSISLPRVRHVLPGRVDYTAHHWQDLYRCRSLGDTARRSTAGRESLNARLAHPCCGSTGWWFPGWRIGPRPSRLFAPFRGKAVDPLVGLGAGHVLERLAQAVLQALDAVLAPPLDGQRLQE